MMLSIAIIKIDIHGLNRRVKELRQEHSQFIEQKRAEAQEALMVMERPTAVKLAEERAKQGELSYHCKQLSHK